jgi:DNA-directed RNA polymerase
LFDFTLKYGKQYDLIIDISKSHKFEYLSKTTKYQENQYKSHKSKIVLQETILEIVNIYKNFNEIYFPFIIDNRGRIYCEPNFFNYQSNELSKSLILFLKPGILERDDTLGINYLKIYGGNCYGLDKTSMNYKIE